STLGMLLSLSRNPPMNLSALLQDLQHNPGDEFNYMVRTRSNVFRVKDVAAFREALSQYIQVSVEQDHVDHVDEVCLHCGTEKALNKLPSDEGAHWPLK